MDDPGPHRFSIRADLLGITSFIRAGTVAQETKTGLSKSLWKKGPSQGLLEAHRGFGQSSEPVTIIAGTAFSNEGRCLRTQLPECPVGRYGITYDNRFSVVTCGTPSTAKAPASRTEYVDTTYSGLRL